MIEVRISVYVQISIIKKMISMSVIVCRYILFLFNCNFYAISNHLMHKVNVSFCGQVFIRMMVNTTGQMVLPDPYAKFKSKLNEMATLCTYFD